MKTGANAEPKAGLKAKAKVNRNRTLFIKQRTLSAKIGLLTTS